MPDESTPNQSINQVKPLLVVETTDEPETPAKTSGENTPDSQIRPKKVRKLIPVDKIIALKNFLFRRKKSSIFKGLLIFLLIFALGAGSGYYYWNKNVKPAAVLGEKRDVYLDFLLEIYDTVKANYWNNVNDPDLAKLYQLGSEKLAGRLLPKEIKNKDDIQWMYTDIVKDMDEAKKLEYSKQLAILVLANLQPFGRSGLFTKKDEENLKNKVKNIDPTSNLYNNLGVDKSASTSEIKQAFDTKSNTLSQVLKDQNATTEQKNDAQSQLQQANRAFDTLSVPDKKTSYDEDKVEATAVDKLLKPNIFYLKIKQESPQTFDEFQKSLSSVAGKEGLDTLIIDLRGNFGGAIDILPYFLGPFIGINQYAYEFFHQGDYTPYKTRVGFIPSLFQYKKVVVLIDSAVQSSGEVMAATFKKYHIGVLVGEHTKGWGSVERVFPIKNQIEPGQIYSMLLVHSLTLRDDNQPIEGKGVDPDINIKDTDWEKQLYSYFNSKDIVDTVKELMSTPAK